MALGDDVLRDAPEVLRIAADRLDDLNETGDSGSIQLGVFCRKLAGELEQMTVFW